MPVNDPRGEYKQRLAARQAVSARYDWLHIRIGNSRLALVGVAVLLAWLAFGQGWLAPWWLGAPAAGYVALMVIHERVFRAKGKADRAAAFYQGGLDRLEGRWAGKGQPGLRFQEESHPYAHDLDIFGKGGLFELLCTARTLHGEETLARWLLAPALPETVRARQEAVDELRDRLDLREELALLGEAVRKGTHTEALPKWGEGTPVLDSLPARVLAAGLASAALGLFIGWAIFGLTLKLFLVAGAVEAAFGLLYRGRVIRVVEAAEHPAHDLSLLAEVLSRLEHQAFASPRLAELRQALETEGHPASQRIARLSRLVELLDSRDNVAVRVIGPPLLWTTQLAFAVESWRKHTGGALRQWLDAVGEIEALSALASYAYERPADPFPEFVGGAAVFEGEALGHPLIPESRCVVNDVKLVHSGLCVLLVSGSNMSGKSTLLRTVGSNAVLALAGAPVRALRLRLSPVSVGASIRVTDSLQGGTSRFYAEILRLRQLIEITRGPAPLLFLLDELLHGTNSHDRRIGAEAVVRELTERGGLGLVTTHDLALAHIAEVLAPRGANVHFEDHLEDGKISFDYLLKPGVVRKSNALELMRSVGLEV